MRLKNPHITSIYAHSAGMFFFANYYVLFRFFGIYLFVFSVSIAFKASGTQKYTMNLCVGLAMQPEQISKRTKKEEVEEKNPIQQKCCAMRRECSSKFSAHTARENKEKVMHTV